MSYQSFQILPLPVECGYWDEKTGCLVIRHQQTIYKIIHPVTQVIYGLKRTVEQAQKAIDRQGKRWLKESSGSN